MNEQRKATCACGSDDDVATSGPLRGLCFACRFIEDEKRARCLTKKAKKITTPKTMTIEEALAGRPWPPDDATIKYMRDVLQPSQLAMFCSRLPALQKPEASRVAAQRFRGNAAAPMTASHLATRLHVGGSMHHARYIREHGAPELVTAVERGQLTLYAAKTICKILPRAEQPDEVKKAIGVQRLGGFYRPQSSMGIEHTRRKPQPETSKVLGRVIETLTHTLAPFKDYLEAELPNDPQLLSDWLTQLRDVQRTVNRFCRRLVEHERTYLKEKEGQPNVE